MQFRSSRKASDTKRFFSRETLYGIERRVARRVYGPAPEREQWLRQTMFDDVDAFLRTLPPEQTDALEISGDFYAEYPWRSYEARHFPAFDVCNPGEVEAHFGLVVCDQVLEHVLDPFTAARTLAALCAPGGYVVVGVPFLVRVHPAPDDFWRFTPNGLRVLLEGAGLDIVSVTGWGNRHCVNANFFVWAKRPRWASNNNEPAFPINVWAIARKPVA